MSFPQNAEGNVTVIVLRDGIWERQQVKMRFVDGRLMEIEGEGFPKPGPGRGFDGEFRVRDLKITPIGENSKDEWSDHHPTHYWVEDGHETQSKVEVMNYLEGDDGA